MDYGSIAYCLISNHFPPKFLIFLPVPKTIAINHTYFLRYLIQRGKGKLKEKAFFLLAAMRLRGTGVSTPPTTPPELWALCAPRCVQKSL